MHEKRLLSVLRLFTNADGSALDNLAHGIAPLIEVIRWSLWGETLVPLGETFTAMIRPNPLRRRAADLMVSRSCAQNAPIGFL